MLRKLLLASSAALVALSWTPALAANVVPVGPDASTAASALAGTSAGAAVAVQGCTGCVALNASTDNVVDGPVTTNSVTTPSVVLSFTTAGYGYLECHFTAVGSGPSILFEASGNNSAFVASNFWAMSATGTVQATAQTPVTTSTYIAPVTGPFMQLRASALASGTLTAFCAMKRGPAPVPGVQPMKTLTSGSLDPSYVPTNGDGLALQTTNTAIQVNATLRGLNAGPTLDRIKTIQGAVSSGLGTLAVAEAPSSATGASIVPITSASVESNHVLKASAGNGYRYSITTGGTAGFLMVFNATSAPADGAVTPVICRVVAANTSLEVEHSRMPDQFATGITVVFSSTGCFNKTASATALFEGWIQ